MRHLFILAFVLALVPTAAFAAGPISPVAFVVCDDRQGSGAFTSFADGGYVVTVGHVVLTPEGSIPKDCAVGFSDDSGEPVVYYDATVVRATLAARTDRDMAVLKLGQRLSGKDVKPAAPIATNEFARVGDAVTVQGYPGSDASHLTMSHGTIASFGRGSVRMNAEISGGYSGGPLLDANGRLLGVATRVNYEVDDKTGKETVISYEAQDVLAIITWMDEEGAGHDTYLTHADAPAYHSLPYVYREEELGCAYTVRTPERSTVYCLSPGDRRYVYPNEATFISWNAGYDQVRYLATSRIAEYRLIGNVTHRAGTLVKITTDPKVYLVTDGIGTLREVPDETSAIRYFGAEWAKRVKDVPDEFFFDYHVGKPIPRWF